MPTDPFIGTSLGRSLSTPGVRPARPTLSDEEREARRLQRETGRAARRKEKAPILDLNSEVTDEDEAAAIQSIQNIVGKDELADVLASIMGAVKNQEKP